MSKLYIYLMLLVVLAVGTAAPALAQSEGEEDGGGSTVIGLTDLANIQQLVTQRNGIVVCYVLPPGWIVGEQGVDKETGELMENINRYVLVSRSPVVDEDDAPDCTFELSIFEHGLLDEMPEGLSEEEQKEYEAQAFLAFLDVQISEALNAGLHCTSRASDIQPIPYGTGNRPYTLFVPIYFETQGGAQIYTFTSAYDGKVWMMKFLVKEDQVENYGGLIAFVLNNSFALTVEEFDEYNRQMAEQAGNAGK